MYFEHRTTTEGSELYSLNIYDKAGKVLTTITKNGDYTEQVSGLVGLKYYNLYSEELAQLALTDLQQLGEAAQLVGLLTIYYPHKAGLLRIILVILLLVALGYLVWQTKGLNHLNRSPVLRLAPLPAFALCVTMMNCDHNGRLITGNTVPLPDSEDVINGMYYVEPGEATRLSTLEGLPLGTYYYHTDHLGSTSVVTDATGEEVTRIVYKPYGEIDHERSTGLHVVTHKFTGQEFDEETELYYYNARYYDPALGRMLTVDDVVPGGGQDTIGFNNYAYARSNPIKYVDPTGNSFWEDVLDFVGDAVKVVVNVVIVASFVVAGALGVLGGALLTAAGLPALGALVALGAIGGTIGVLGEVFGGDFDFTESPIDNTGKLIVAGAKGTVIGASVGLSFWAITGEDPVTAER